MCIHFSLIEWHLFILLLFVTFKLQYFYEMLHKFLIRMNLGFLYLSPSAKISNVKCFESRHLQKLVRYKFFKFRLLSAKFSPVKIHAALIKTFAVVRWFRVFDYIVLRCYVETCITLLRSLICEAIPGCSKRQSVWIKRLSNKG